MQPTSEDIANLAYQFYLEDGKPEGFAEDHWKRAEEFLRHPENHSDDNVLAPPSEPELTRALDEKAVELDTELPSDPHTGDDAVHQEIEIAVDGRGRGREKEHFHSALKHLAGIEGVKMNEGRLFVSFDARRTNPAAIHEALFDGEPAEV